MIGAVASGLSVTTWNQPDAVANLTISTMASSIPAELSSALGASPTSLVNQLYSFGSSPSNATLGNYAITLLENSYANMTTADAGFSVSDLMDSSYQLGSSPNETQTWNLACDSYFKRYPKHIFRLPTLHHKQCVPEQSPIRAFTERNNRRCEPCHQQCDYNSTLH